MHGLCGAGEGNAADEDIVDDGSGMIGASKDVMGAWG